MTATSPSTGPLDALTAGQLVPFGGDRVAVVSTELAAAFAPGDRLVVVQETGDLLHVPRAEHELTSAVVGRAVEAFGALAACSDEQITEFFARFADHLADEDRFAAIARANAEDVERASARGRSTTRLTLSASMRAAMIDGLRTWRDASIRRDALERVVTHEGWSVELRRAPLGVIGFVFEGRPNVFADAAGVVRSGNAVVFRIGSDALGTARAIAEHALDPAIAAAGLPPGVVGLVPSAAHAAGWALFADRRLALAVARGSGPAVAQLGSVARQAGVPVSLHGTGGAWLVAAADADPERFARVVRHSLDRKVCNTLNVCCIERGAADRLVPVFVEALRAAGRVRGTAARLHVEAGSTAFVPEGLFREQVRVVRADGTHDEPFATALAADRLGHEWEWEDSPEVSLVVVDDLDDAIARCNRWSPRFVASLVSEDPAAHARFYDAIDAPFVGDGFTRWVDGQYALDAPELGLSNWEHGRLLGRGAILSGDSAHTVRYRARFADADVHR
jgi:glutamate-5-semialdehyde dehydrogenase